MKAHALALTSFGLAALAAVAIAPHTAPERTDGLDAPVLAGSDVLLVDVADDMSAQERAEFIATLPGSPRLNSAFSEEEGLYRLELDPTTLGETLDALRGDPRVEFVEPEGTYEAFGILSNTPDDPLYPFQWHLEDINVEGAWDTADGGGVVVAVIDTGVAFADASNGPFRRVEDLEASRLVPGYDFVSDDDQPHDEHGHGTHVAGSVAQTTDNGYGGAGVAPNALIMPIRVLDRSGRGNTADIAESIRWAADNGADVINMSLGGPLPSRIMQDAVAYAHRKGVTVIAAAGNSGWSMPSYPAAYRNVVAVAATQYDRTTTFYSNYGRYIDIAAPGGNTRVDQNNDGRPDGVLQETLTRENPAEHEFALYMGTSMASPHVAGVAALIHQMGITHPERVEAVLTESASRDVPDYQRDRYGAGLLDAKASVNTVLTRVHAPRGVLAAALALLGLAFAAGSSRGGRKVSAIGAVAVAAAVASGSTLAALLASAAGIDVSILAGSTGSILRAPSIFGLDSLASSVLLLSAVPVVGVYALFGGVRGRVATTAVLGVMFGLTATLLGEALVPTVDVLGVPGMGVADRVWLVANALVALLVGVAAARR